MEKFTLENKKISVFKGNETAAPVVWLNTFSNEGGQAEKMLNDIAPDHTLVSVGNLNWDNDMSPWSIPPVSKNGDPCSGGAEEYLHFMTSRLMPAVYERLGARPEINIIAGYSLAGLFALWSLYQTGIFSSAASISGSMWFPGFAGYVRSHDFIVQPDFLYFSLGDKESRTLNPLLAPVQTITEELYSYYRASGIKTVFELNKGGHTEKAVSRSAKGIAWVLEQYKDGG